MAPRPGKRFDRGMSRLRAAVGQAAARSRRRRAVLVSWLLVVLMATGGGVYVASAQEYPVRDVQLHDAGVWVSNSALMQVARWNTQSQAVETEVSFAGASGLDLLQEETTVFGVDPVGHTLRVVDPVLGTASEPVPLPAKAQIGLGAGIAAVLDPQSGRLWRRPAPKMASLQVAAERPDASAGADAALAVGADGTVYVASAQAGTLLTLRPDQAEPEVTKVEGLAGAEELSVSAVGSQAVLLDAARQLLWAGTRRVSFSGLGKGAALQQPSATSDFVVIASSTGLHAISLKGDAAQTLAPGAQKAQAPVQLGGCAYGVWSGNAHYAVGAVPGHECSLATEGAVAVRDAAPQAELRLRVNRGRVVINNLDTGDAWPPQEQQKAKKVSWSSDEPGDDEDETQKNPDDVSRRTQKEKAPKQKNQRPRAENDSYGARVGQGTVLRVLENDSDPDGDVILVDEVSAVTGAAEVSVVQNGQAVQVTAEGEGTVGFRYRISDADGATDQASVTVKIIPQQNNGAPELRAGADPSASVATGRKVTYDVLADWTDPDGDPLVLQGATAPGGGTVRYTPQGMVTYTDDGAVTGARTVDVSVWDGRKTSEAELAVQVLDAEPRPPVARNDVAGGLAGVPLTVSALLNDSDPNDDPLHVVAVTAPKGVEAVVDATLTQVVVTAQEPGSYELGYTVSDGELTTTGQVRAQIAADVSNSAPTAVDDTLFVPVTGVGQVDLTANDVDPDGDVLVVQQIDEPERDGVEVAVLEHRMLRVWATADVAEPIHLRYTVSDGKHQAEGTVTIRSSGSVNNQPPEAVDDAVAVRAGDVVSVPVLGNDSDPDGDQLTLDPRVTTDDGADVLFVSGKEVRFQAPGQPGTVVAVYTVHDGAGNEASAQVTFTVRAREESAENRSPAAEDVQARVLAGGTVQIPVPLSGIDPDGDSTFLLGADSAPGLGRVVGTENGDTLLYEAYDEARGTDVFRYRVVDARGASSTGVARVGIAQPVNGNQDPTAVDDTMAVRPGRTISVPVLDNDVDPDNNALRLASEQTLPEVAGGSVLVEGSRVVLAAPATEGKIIVPYEVEDGRGGRDSASLVLDVRADAPLASPIARDDIAQADAEDIVRLDVRTNDDDPDGEPSGLEVALIGPGAEQGEIDTEGRVGLRRQETASTVAYRVTDVDGNSAEAFVWVPGTDNQPPRLRDDVTPLVVATGQSATIKVADWVEDPEGSPLRLAGDKQTRPKAVHGEAKRSDDGVVQFTAEGGYGGPASVTFTVQDDPGQRAGGVATATITVPITVTSTETSPELRPTRLTVTPGERPASVDLAGFVIEPGAQPSATYRFALGSPKPKGVISPSLNGSVLAVSASDGGEGKTAELPVTVTNQAGTSAKGVVTVVVAGASLLRTHEYSVSGRMGSPIELPWQENVSGSAEPQLTGAATVSPAEAGKVVRQGDSLILQPRRNWTGSASVTYRVTDNPSDPQRSVAARAVVTVQGPPGAPGIPKLVQVGDGTATLTWIAAQAHGSTVTGYRVQAQRVSQDCPQTRCTITGLSNGSSYRFTVTAVNAIGSGPASGPSAAIVPENRPDIPAAPSVTFLPGGNGGQLALSWAPVRAPRDAAVTYQVRVGPADVAPITTTSTSLTVSGLKNGTAYSFKVRARTEGNWTGYSPASSPETPAGIPAPPGAPQVSQQSESELLAQWQPPANNGAAITGYTLRVSRDRSAVQEIELSGASTSRTVVLEPDHTYVLALKARNRSGESEEGPSAVWRMRSAPDQVGEVSAQAGDAQATLSFAEPEGLISYFEYSANDGSWERLSGRTVGGLENGTSYRFRVRACGVQACGEASGPSNAVTPFGPPGQATAEETGKNVANASFSVRICPPENTGRGIDRLEYSVNNGAWRNAPASCSTQQAEVSNYEKATMRVRAVDTSGVAGPEGLTSFGLSMPVLDAKSVDGEPSPVLDWRSTIEFRLSGDFPEGVSDFRMSWGKWPCRYEGGSRPASGRADVDRPFSDEAFSYQFDWNLGARICGASVTNTWTGEVLVDKGGV